MTTAAPVRVLIVDDEALSPRGLRVRLESHPGIAVIGECADGLSALRAIGELTPDIVMLDVMMPGLDGLELVEAVGAARMPVVVFVTAHDEHAIHAFDAEAADYVLKPIDAERLTRAMTRAVDRVMQRRAASATDMPRPATLQCFLVIRLGRRLVVRAEEVDWISAEGDYVRLHVGPARHLLRETMIRLEAQLDPGQFVRIHRSAIVAIARIRELHSQPNRELIVILKDGTRLRVSRSFRARLDAHFDM